MFRTPVDTQGSCRDGRSTDGEPTRPSVICFPFIGDVIGGSHISVLGLIRRLDRRRFTPLVVLQHMDGPVGELFRSEGIATTQAPGTCRLLHGRRVGLRELASLVADVPAIVRFLRQSNVAIVHSNDGRVHAAWALPARLAGAKLLWHHRGNPNAMGLRRVAPLLANRVVSVSRFAAPRTGRLARPGGHIVVHSPFATDLVEDRDLRRAELLSELGCPPETRILGFFGSLISRKRPLLFVEAVAALKRQLPGRAICGVMFGEILDDSARTVPALANQLGIGDQIRLMGFRHPGTRWLAACDLLLVPAIDEPFGRTLIEAMLLGIPVVASASGGNIEALLDGSTGMLVPPEDAEALASAARRLLDDSELYTMIARAAQIDARSRFGEDKHCNAIARIYEELLGYAEPGLQAS